VIDRRSWYLAHIEADAERFAAAVRTGDLGAPIAACPGWDLRRLTSHMGVVQRWATHCAIHVAAPESRDAFQPDPAATADELADYLIAGSAALTAALAAIEPDAPTWHPFPFEQVAGVWSRRQAHEISVHRWDAEHAVGTTTPIDPELASDGVDEHLELMLPRLLSDGKRVPSGTLHLHCTDTDGEWLLSYTGGEYALVRAHQKGDAALRGPAEALLLRTWNRDSQRISELSPVGDDSVVASWLG
jgi:uncharacterized protein (TIGR03083 family)